MPVSAGRRNGPMTRSGCRKTRLGESIDPAVTTTCDRVASGAVGAYEFDVFISYRRKGAPYEWVKNYFAPMIEQWLPEAMDREPAIFVDEDTIEAGDHWPERLRDGLAKSRCLLPVWTPSYFRSRWCVAEWRTMRRRESLTRKTAIVPVTFRDGDDFPNDAKSTQQHGFHDFAYTAPAFRNSSRFIDFENEVKKLSTRLRRVIDDAPPWESRWPVLEPEPEHDSTQPLPRLAK